MHNEFSGNGATIVQAGVICGSVSTTSSHATSQLVVFLQAVELLGAQPAFKQVAALTTLLRLVEEFPDMLHSVMVAIDQWGFPPEMAEQIGYTETIKVKMKEMRPHIQCILRQFGKFTPPEQMVELNPVLLELAGPGA